MHNNKTLNGRSRYTNKPLSVQILALITMFFGNLAMGWTVARVLGGLSHNASIVLYVPFIVIMFFGYSVWSARLQLIAFNMPGKNVLHVCLKLLLRRKEFRQSNQVLTDHKKLNAVLVKAYKTANSFFLVSLAVAALASVGALMIDNTTGPFSRFTVVGLACVAWGWGLSQIARRGFLPIPENARFKSNAIED